MQQLASVDTVVATRYHNVLCALKLAKPTLSIGYAPKFDALMAEMGLAEFCQSARSLDVDRLIKQFTELESRSAQLQQDDDGVQCGKSAASRPPICHVVRRALPGSRTSEDRRVHEPPGQIPI